MLEKFIDFGKWCNLLVNAKKSMIWSNNSEIKEYPGGIKVSTAPYRYLGIHLDPELKWEKEQEVIDEMMRKDLELIQRLWMCDPEQKVWAVNAMAISRLRWHSQIAVMKDPKLETAKNRMEAAVVRGHWRVTEKTRKLLYAPKAKGGLGMLDPMKTAKAALVHAVRGFKIKMAEEGNGQNFVEEVSVRTPGKKAPMMREALGNWRVIAAELGCQIEQKGIRMTSWDELGRQCGIEAKAIEKLKRHFPEPATLFGIRKNVVGDVITPQGVTLIGTDDCMFNREAMRFKWGIQKEVDAVVSQIKRASKRIGQEIPNWSERSIPAVSRLDPVRISQPDRDFCIIATDGSKGTNSMGRAIFGAAFADSYSGISDGAQLEECRSIEQAEWRAVVQMLAALPMMEGRRPRKVILAIDRQAVILALRNPRDPEIPEGKLAKELMREWESKGFEFEVRHVYSHQIRVLAGGNLEKARRMELENRDVWKSELEEAIALNETADRLAGAAVADPRAGKVWPRNWSKDEIVTLSKNGNEARRLALIAKDEGGAKTPSESRANGFGGWTEAWSWRSWTSGGDGESAEIGCFRAI